MYLCPVANRLKQLSLLSELGEDTSDLSRLRGEISELRTPAESQHREYKYLLEMLERQDFLYRKNPPLITSTE